MPPKTNLTEEQIRKLWRTPSFPGSFAGIATMQAALEHEKGQKVSQKRLFEIMRQDPDFVLEMKKVRKTFERRKLLVHGVGVIWQSDVAFLPPINGYIGFLLCIDLFSRKIFCSLLKTKDAAEIKASFKKIFAKAKLTPHKLETDKGSEFLGNKKFFDDKDIFFKVKIGRNKASFAERAIQTVKGRLYRLLRTLMTDKWPKYLQKVVKAINNSPKHAIGNLRPNDISTTTDGPLIDAAAGIPEDVPVEKQKENQKSYESDPRKIQVGDHVHVDFGPDVFEKGFDSPNYQLFKVVRIDAGKKPVLYKLSDLRKRAVKGYFYGVQLTKAPEPSLGETFRVEKVLRSKMEGKKELVYVKYLHYGDEFNQWIPRSNIVKGADEN